MLFKGQAVAQRGYSMSFEFIVTINGIFQMRGGLTQATTFLISLYGSLDAGISAGARILPELRPLPLELAANSDSSSSEAETSWYLTPHGI